MTRKSCRFCAVVPIAWAMLIALNASAEDCRAIEDDGRRLDCYDRQSAGAEASPAAESESAQPLATRSAPVPAQEATTTESSEPLHNEVSRETIKAREREAERDVTGHVRSCKSNARGRYFFFFDNGEVWKQVDNTRIRWRECDFDVTIRKDFFGYMLQPADDRQKVRVSRVE